MPTSNDCWPWFHAKFHEISKLPQVTVSSGCAVNGQGNVACEPESMRANAEAKMRSAGLLNRLSLETYTLSRYMHSEVGSGSVEERVAVGEAARNRARRENTTINGLLLYRQKSGSPNRGYYGPIHGVGTGTSTAPYGRWASTSRDPTALTILLADLITSGDSGDFARGADDQDGPEHWAPKGQASLDGYVKNLAARGKYWIGPLPGIDHWHTFLQFTPGISASLPPGQALLARGLEALRLPIRRPQWNPNMPICARGADQSALLAIAAVGLLGGAWAFTKSLFRGFGKRVV